MSHTFGRNEAAPAVSQAGIWDSEHFIVTVGLLLTIVGAAFEALAVATTMPATASELGGIQWYGWAFSAYMLANLVGIVVAGAESDRSGPLRPFGVGVGMFTLGLLIAGLALRMEMLIVGRAVQGFGAGFVSSTVYVVIGRAYAAEVRPRMIALTSTAWVVPGLVGPTLAGAVADLAGWRWVFLGLIPLPLLAAVMALPALRRLDRRADQPRDLSRTFLAVRLALGTGMLLGGLGMLARHERPELSLPLILLGAGLGLPALRRLLPPGTLLVAPGLPAVIATQGLLNMAFFGADAFVPLALTHLRGQSITMAGVTLTAATISWSSGSWVQAYFAQRGARRTLSLAGLALMLIGIVGVIVVFSPQTPLWLAPLCWGLAGLGIGLTYSTNSLLMLESAPAGQEGSASSGLQLANMIGVALGTGIGGVLIGTEGAEGLGMGITTHFMLLAGVTVLALLAALRLPARPASGAAPA